MFLSIENLLYFLTLKDLSQRCSERMGGDSQSTEHCGFKHSQYQSPQMKRRANLRQHHKYLELQKAGTPHG